MTQDSRKAIIELLFLSLYTDNHLSLAEDGVLNDALESLGWDSPSPRENFIFSAFASARDAIADPAKAEKHFTSRAEIIKGDGSEGAAFTWLSRVLGSDGLTATEKRFLSRLQASWYPE
jgi:hypothetical protein